MTSIVETFTELALSQPVAEITVKELVAKARVGRSTFYDHFESVEQLLLWLVDALVDWSRDDRGRMQLDQLLAFAAGLPEVSSAFLEVGTCSARCESAMADALIGSPAQRRFAAAGAMGSLRAWLADDDRSSVEEFVGQTRALVDAALGH